MKDVSNLSAHRRLTYFHLIGTLLDRRSIESCSVMYSPIFLISITIKIVRADGHTGNDPPHRVSSSETEINRSVDRGGMGRAGGTVTSS